MKYLIILFALLLLIGFIACSTKTSNLEQIQQQIHKNGCELNRQSLVYKIHDLEYENDTLYSEIPFSLIPDSICVCPTDSSVYLFIQDDERLIQCPNGHGDSEV